MVHPLVSVSFQTIDNKETVVGNLVWKFTGSSYKHDTIIINDTRLLLTRNDTCMLG